MDTAADTFNINAKYLNLTTIVLLQFFSAHMLGCFWFAIAAPPDIPDCTPETENCPQHTLLFYQNWVYTEGLQGGDVGTQYLVSLYWAFATMSTAGYGDVSAVNNTERLASIACMVVGVTVFGYTLLRVSFVLVDGDPREAAQKRKKEQVAAFLDRANLPRKLTKHVRRYFDDLVDMREQTFEAQSLFHFLHPTLRNVVECEVRRAFVRIVD